jgi:hypothetical protein
MSRPIKEPVSGYSPFYGCGIMVAAGLIFGGIIAWSAYSLFKQNAEIDLFTIATPSLPERRPLSPDAAKALAEKTAALQKTVAAGQPASLTLTLDELNTLIAEAPDLGNGSYAEIVRFVGTDPDKNLLHAAISLPLNPLPFSGKPKRYLVGTATFQVEVTSEGPDARIIAIEVPDKTVPAGFVESQKVWTWVTPYRTHAEFAATLKALRSARVTADGLSLSTADK